MHRFRSAVSHLVLALAEAGLIALLVVGLAAGTAFAARGGGSGSSLTMVPLSSTDGTAHYGQRITFKVVTTNQYPVVSVTCSQNGTMVFGDSHPIYWPNAWADPGICTLAPPAWTGGAADCRADLKASSRNKIVTLASTTFHVYP